jgi:hypothetical protein
VEAGGVTSPLGTRPVHRGHKASIKGVSALCFKRPRAIDLRVATWTNRDEAVTCPKCLAILAAKEPS